MKRPSLLSLVYQLIKVYFSDITNKQQEYKKLLFYYLKDMGGVYIKFLQMICITQKFLDGWGSPKEFEVFNKVYSEDINIYDYIDQAQFSYIETKPFACGSFAQLYKAKLNSKEIVAIKILRPSVSFTLKKDLRKLKTIVKLVNNFLPNTVIDYQSALSEFSSNCLLETDYEREISNMEYFSKIYQNHPYVIIPKVYTEFCSKNVIVQEFIDGPTLADAMENVHFGDSLENYVFEHTGSDVWKQIVIAGGEALRTAITADFVFGDPHPGNIILLPNNKIAFVDFGIIARKPTSQKAFYLWMKSYYDVLKGGIDYGNLLETTCMCFCPDLVNALNQCSTTNSFFKSIATAVNKKAKTMNQNNSDMNLLMQNGHFVSLFTKFIDNKNALNLKLDMHNFQLLKAMQAFICSVTTIDNKYGNNQFSNIMVCSMEYALEYCNQNGVNDDLNLNTKYSINESYELLLDNLSKLANTDEFLFENICERMFL